MAGLAVTQAPLPGQVLTNGGGGGDGGGAALLNALQPADYNDIRISVVIDRLNQHLRGQHKSDTTDFFNLCLNLSRGIDVAIANHQLPSRAQELPLLTKQVCQCKNDTFFNAVIMVLMISVKGACQSGWFSDKDSEELKNLTRKFADGFGSASLSGTEPSCNNSIISTVISRFYPRMKMGHVFVFMEIKPGFEAYLSDFQVPKNLKQTSPGDKIMLFVVQTDNIETSSCLVSPAKVNFLLNGKGVERRTSLFVDNGPQTPTAVTRLLKYGPNLFQAVGEFNGNYIIGIAIMSEMPSLDSNVLQDYEQHAPTTVDSDSELIEGQSRISLNCPFSFSRIRTPVKGHSCKHIQCFDFDNYVGINSRRPFWRCPHCNQHVCFTDLRIDKKLAKVLKNVEANVADIIIHPDGSWNPDTYSDNAIEKPEDNCKSPQPQSLLDLTQTDDVMDFITTNETEDRKFPLNVFQNQFTTQTVPVEPHTASVADNSANQRIHRVEDDYWSGVYVSPVVQGLEEIAPTQVFINSCTTSREAQDFNGNHNSNSAIFTNSGLQREPMSLQNSIQLQQYQFGNSNYMSEYGMCPRVLPRNVTRVPTAVQALPAQASSSVLHQRFRGNLAATTQPSSAAAPAISNPSALRTQMSSSPLQQYTVTRENSSFSSVRPTQQQIIGLPVPNQVQDVERALERHRSFQQMSNFRLPRTTTSPPVPANFLQTQQVSPSNTTRKMATEASRIIPPSYSANPNTVLESHHHQHNTRVTPPPPPLLTTSDNDQNWRPVNRMRGALTGQAYTDAYNRFFNQNQPNQQPANYPPARPSNLGNFPNGLSGMH